MCTFLSLLISIYNSVLYNYSYYCRDYLLLKIQFHRWCNSIKLPYTCIFKMCFLNTRYISFHCSAHCELASSVYYTIVSRTRSRDMSVFLVCVNFHPLSPIWYAWMKTQNEIKHCLLHNVCLNWLKKIDIMCELFYQYWP